MDTRLGLLSAAAFAGVVIGGLLIADPGVAGSLNPSGLFGDSEEDHEGDEEYDDEGGEYEDDEDEYDEHDEHEHGEHEDDDDREGSGSTRSSEVRFARDSHGDDNEDDD